LDHFRLTRSALHKGLWTALQSGNLNAFATLARALDQNVEAAAKLSGEWHEEPRSVTNIAIMQLPGVASTIAAITRALAG
jgi:hypothetical protein